MSSLSNTNLDFIGRLQKEQTRKETRRKLEQNKQE